MNKLKTIVHKKKIYGEHNSHFQISEGPENVLLNLEFEN